MAGVTIGTMALIVVLSVFNGFEGLVKSLYNSFHADISITVKEGKTFDLHGFPVDQIKKMDGVKTFTEVIEENVLLRYHDKQDIVTMKAVSEDFEEMTGIDSMLVRGEFKLLQDKTEFAVLGYIVDYRLGINLNDYKTPIGVFVPKRGKLKSPDPTQAFNNQFIFPSGTFSIQQDFDSKYIIVPINFARRLLDYDTEVTSIEIGTNKGLNTNQLIESIKQLLGSDYIIKNRFQQHELLYKIMKSEKLGIYLILSFILFIATFNIIGSLSMLILDKKKDIGILQSMGASDNLIKRIFLTEGLLISLTGAIAGLIIGALLCLVQMRYGIIKLQGGDSFVINTYPVEVHFSDFMIVFCIVFIMGLGAAWYPVRQISRKHLNQKIY
ncbi:FtsX-like permease family protein [candidate division KSB1 bacterium]